MLWKEMHASTDSGILYNAESQKLQRSIAEVEKDTRRYTVTRLNRQYGNTSRGGDLGGWGRRFPQNLRWGTAHASVPPIFREVVLSDAGESVNRVKKVFFLRGKGHIRHLT